VGSQRLRSVWLFQQDRCKLPNIKTYIFTSRLKPTLRALLGSLLRALLCLTLRFFLGLLLSVSQAYCQVHSYPLFQFHSQAYSCISKFTSKFTFRLTPKLTFELTFELTLSSLITSLITSLSSSLPSSLPSSLLTPHKGVKWASNMWLILISSSVKTALHCKQG
jgi:hypothetical protein